jgi:hypothetical protein
MAGSPRASSQRQALYHEDRPVDPLALSDPAGTTQEARGVDRPTSSPTVCSKRRRGLLLDRTRGSQGASAQRGNAVLDYTQRRRGTKIARLGAQLKPDFLGILNGDWSRCIMKPPSGFRAASSLPCQVPSVFPLGAPVEPDLAHQKIVPDPNQPKKAGFAAGLPGSIPKNENYFLGAIASLAALATRNFTTVLALI